MTAMEVHDRRLSISKASASKISKPSPDLKNPSPSLMSSSPPSQLPSSITSSPSRPIARVVNADPSSFRRVVQELTGTTLPSTTSTSSSNSSTAAPRMPSRLHRIAPPPLRSDTRGLQHHQTLFEQMQHQQASHILLLQQNLPKVGHPSTSLPFTEFGNPNPSLNSETAPQFGNPNPNFTPSLPMLSLSPLPALTPSDNTWANPIEVISNSPKSMINTSNSLPPLLPLPNVSTGNSSNGYDNALLAKPAYTGNVYTDAMLTRPIVSHGQSLPPLLSTPPLLHMPPTSSFNVLPPLLHMPPTSSFNVLPPWSPTPFPFSPGLFPPSPGPRPTTVTLSHVNNGNPDAHIRYSSINPTMPKNLTF